MKKSKKLLVLIPFFGLFLSSCSFQEGLATAKSWLDDHGLESVGNLVEKISGEKEQNEVKEEENPQIHEEGIKTISVTGVELDKDSLKLKVNEKATVVATVLPENASDKSVTWSSANERVATVEGGLITAVGNGETTISVVTNDGNFSKFIRVVVTTDAIDLVLSHSELTLEKGSSEKIIAKVVPSTATIQVVEWTIDDPSIASVENGEVFAIAKGSATITATIQGTNISKSVVLNVEEHFPITISSYEGISISVSSNSAQAGEEVTVVAQEVEELTYDVTHVLYNDCYAEKQNDGSYKFIMPEEAVSISVKTTAIVAHNVNISSLVDEEIVTLEGDVWSAKRTTQMNYTLNLKNEGYEVNKVRFVGQDEDLLNHETSVVSFEMPDEEVTLVIDYSGKYYAVSMLDSLIPVKLIKFDNKDLVDGKAQYDSLVYVEFDGSDSYFKVHKPLYIKIDEGEEDLISVSNNGASFKMPAHDVEIEVISETITHSFTLLSSENIALSAYELINDQLVEFNENKAYFGQKVYVKASFNESEYAIKSLKCDYETDSFLDPNKSINLLDGAHEEEGSYVFEMPEIKEGTSLTVSVEEEFIKYEGAFFLGNYIGVDFTSVGDTKYFSSYRSFSLEKTGNYINSYGDVDGSVASVDEYNKTITVNRTYYDAIPFKFFDKVVICGASLNSSTYEPNFTLAVKLGEGETSSDYKIYGERFLGGELTAIELYRKNAQEEFELYETVVYLKSTGEFMFGLSFEFSEGEHVTDSVVSYSIKSESEVLFSVYTEGSGYTGRKLLDGLQGEYNGFDGENALKLTLDGKCNAFFNEESEARAYEISEEGKVVIVEESEEAKTTYTFTLDSLNGTFTLNKVVEENETPVVNAAFIGNEYRSNSWSANSRTYYFYITFKEDNKCDFYRKQGSNKSCSKSDVDYSIDGNIVTVSYTDTYSGASQLVLTYDESTDKFTITSKSGYFGLNGDVGMKSSVTSLTNVKNL